MLSVAEPPLKPKMHRNEQQAAAKNAECKPQVKRNITLEFSQLKRLLNSQEI